MSIILGPAPAERVKILTSDNDTWLISLLRSDNLNKYVDLLADEGNLTEHWIEQERYLYQPDDVSKPTEIVVKYKTKDERFRDMGASLHIPLKMGMGWNRYYIFSCARHRYILNSVPNGLYNQLTMLYAFSIKHADRAEELGKILKLRDSAWEEVKKVSDEIKEFVKPVEIGEK